MRWNYMTEQPHFTASLSHSKQNEIWHSTTLPASQPGGTFTNLLAVDGARKKKVENRNIRKACPCQEFFTTGLRFRHELVQTSIWTIDFTRQNPTSSGWVLEKLWVVQSFCPVLYMRHSEVLSDLPHSTQIPTLSRICWSQNKAWCIYERIIQHG